MKHIILDVDNCISDDGWRIKDIDFGEGVSPFKKYMNYHLLAPFDKPANQHIYRAATESASIIIITSRPDCFRVSTEEWLVRNGVFAVALLMRPENDMTPSPELKRQLLLEHAKDHDEFEIDSIVAAHDDRQDVVNMYTKLGIPAQITSIHNISYEKEVDHE
jgi:hypothetical protein